MFAKLVKYEFKATWRIMAILLGTLVIITAAGCIYMSIPVVKDLGNYYGEQYNVLRLISSLLGVFYVLFLIAAGVGSVIYIVIRYYRSMYTDEGYLTHTLPVSTAELIWSKFLTMAVWIFLTACIITVSVFLMAATGAGTEFSLSFSDIGAFEHETGISVAGFIAEMLISVIIGTAACVFEIYAAIALGQQSASHKVFMSILWYVVFYIIIQVVSSAILIISGFSGALMNQANSVNVGGFINSVMLAGNVTNVILGAIFYFIAYYNTKKKLNLA